MYELSFFTFGSELKEVGPFSSGEAPATAQGETRIGDALVEVVGGMVDDLGADGPMVDAYAGVTADQIAAAAIGQDTMLPSMELATESLFFEAVFPSEVCDHKLFCHKV